MDAFARGLKNACRMQHEAVLSRAKAERYKSFKSGIGAKITAGTTSLEELEVRFRSVKFVIFSFNWSLRDFSTKVDFASIQMYFLKSEH